MPAVRMSSPTAAHFRGKLTSQVRRVLPAYLVLVLLILFFTNTRFFTAPIRAARSYKRELRYQQPLRSSLPAIPRKVWQTWKTGPLTFDERDHTVAQTWVEKNPQYRYEVLTDDNDIQYVEWHYGPSNINRPDIVDLYRSITTTIIKADLLRYLIMYAEGGVYADIDVEALKPISRFIPERYSEAEIDMVIGVEIDQPEFKDHPILGPKSQSFCQWTFAAKPRLPIMLRLIENIQTWLVDLSSKRGVPISELHLDFDEVISGTGPSAFTTAMLAQLTVQNKGVPVTWDEFHNMGESKLITGVLVLTVEAFAAGQGHSDSGNHNSRGALVKHHYHASGWPTLHPRHSHPMYGEVERCNWEPFCVATWDHDIAEWDTLSKDEQQQRISEKPPELFPDMAELPGFPEGL